jgi:hypothetical protein
MLTYADVWTYTEVGFRCIITRRVRLTAHAFFRRWRQLAERLLLLRALLSAAAKVAFRGVC